MDQRLQELKAIAEKLPAAVQKNAVALVERMGMKIEGIGDDSIEWRAPMSRVVQPSSDRSKLPKGAQIGSILIDENIQDQPLRTIPIRMWDSRQLWSPDKDEAKVLCYSPNGKLGSKYGLCKDCQFGKFDPEANRSACNKGKTFLNIKADMSSIFVTSFFKTNYKFGSDWSKRMAKAGVAPFKRIYEMTTETSKEYKNVESLMVNIPDKPADQNTPAEYVPFLENLFTKMSEDREAYLKRFEETVNSRGTTQVAALENKSGQIEDAVPATEALPTPEQVTQAKSYQL